ncbi:MAG: ATP-binding cassette domain-containing protein [Gammaproteobacteria bacterium]|nr:ATP-binding cassette domain-containing protein [Gammaproteobacteria bacterium]
MCKIQRLIHQSLTPKPLDALTLRGVSKRYDNGTTALKGIDLDVEQGDFFALLGPNGAGKSTAIGIIASLVRKSGGAVKLFGFDLDTQADRAKACIGIVPQEFNFNVFENARDILLNQAGYYGLNRRLALERSEKYLCKLDLWDKRETRSRDLSGGMKRRLMIARALVHEPRLLILDEPTAGVDLEIRHAIWSFMREMNAAGTTIILTTHYLEEAELLCRNIAIIHRGEIVERAAMGTLVAELKQEVFVLNLAAPLSAPPALTGFSAALVDSTTLEIAVTREQSLNEAFNALSAAGVAVVSLRNKTNRLEQMFLALVNDARQSTSSETLLL